MTLENEGALRSKGENEIIAPKQFSGLYRTLTECSVGHVRNVFGNKKGSTATNNYMLQEPPKTLTIYERGQEEAKRQV